MDGDLTDNAVDEGDLLLLAGMGAEADVEVSNVVVLKEGETKSAGVDATEAGEAKGSEDVRRF